MRVIGVYAGSLKFCIENVIDILHQACATLRVNATQVPRNFRVFHNVPHAAAEPLRHFNITKNSACRFFSPAASQRFTSLYS